MPSVSTTRTATGSFTHALPLPARARLLTVSLAMICASAACAQAQTQTQTQAERDADFAAQVPQPAPLDISEPPPTPRPPLNPQPQHGIKVSGRLPAHMDAGLRVMYATTSRKAECVDIVSMFGKVVGGDAKRFEEPMEIRHTDDRFEADLFLDKYGPGECGWRLLDADLWVRKPTPDGPALVYMGAVIDVSRYDTPESEPMCRVPKRADGRGCDEEQLGRRVNADPSIPVFELCRALPKRNHEGARPRMECDEMDDHTKKRHLIKPETRTVTIDIYDLDRESGPPIPNSKESK